MNTNMAACAQNSQIFNIIYFMRWINMMNAQFLFFFLTNETFMGIIKKGSFSVITRTLSVIRVVFSFSFKFIKRYLLTLIRTKLGISIFFTRYRNPTCFAFFKYLSWTFFTPFKKANATTKCTPFIFASSDVRWSLKEFFRTFFAVKHNFYTTRRFIANTRAVFSSVFFKRFLAYRTNLHMPIIYISNG